MAEPIQPPAGHLRDAISIFVTSNLYVTCSLWIRRPVRRRSISHEGHTFASLPRSNPLTVQFSPDTIVATSAHDFVLMFSGFLLRNSQIAVSKRQARNIRQMVTVACP